MQTKLITLLFNAKLLMATSRYQQKCAEYAKVCPLHLRFEILQHFVFFACVDKAKVSMAGKQNPQ